VRVLVVEDDVDLAEVLRDGLAEEGFAVDLSLEGEDGLWRATTVEYDAVVLDIMLPKVDGLEILRRMRAGGHRAPVLLLTAKDSIPDRVLGLDSGADDYLVKPFAWDELLARIRVLLRRGPRGSDGRLRYGDLVMDPARHVVWFREEPVTLTAKEFQVLEVFLRQPEEALTRTRIMERTYDDDTEAESNIIDVFVCRLRRKLASHGAEDLLHTVRGVGYMLGGKSHAKP
jgi:two-component system OmpR family response regulator